MPYLAGLANFSLQRNSDPDHEAWPEFDQFSVMEFWK